MSLRLRADDWAAIAVAAGLIGLGAYAVSRLDSVKLLSLDPEMRRRVEVLIARLAARGIKLKLGSATRTEAEHAKAIAEGKTATKVTWHFSGRGLDVYVYDPNTGKPDLAGKRLDLYRIVHQEWARLGGQGLAFLPYPDGPVRYITGAKGPIWDGAHLEFHGPYATAAAAWAAYKAA